MAVFWDSDFLIRTQICISKIPFLSSKIVSKHLYIYSCISFILPFLCFLEVSIYAFPFVSISLCRHVENFCRMSAPISSKFSKFSFFVNCLSIIRNTFVAFLLFIAPFETYYLAFFLGLLSILLNFALLSPKLSFDFKNITNAFRSLLSYAIKLLFSIKRRSAYLSLPWLTSLSANIDRIIIAYFPTSLLSQSYLQVKTMMTYPEALSSIPLYKDHINKLRGHNANFKDGVFKDISLLLLSIIIVSSANHELNFNLSLLVISSIFTYTARRSLGISVVLSKKFNKISLLNSFLIVYLLLLSFILLIGFTISIALPNPKFNSILLYSIVVLTLTLVIFYFRSKLKKNLIASSKNVCIF